MKTQQDNQVRMVALENLKAMCERASDMCHRYWIEKVTRSRVWVGYSNPNEYGTEHPFYAVFPSYPSGWREDEDNPRVVLDCLRIVGGGDSASIDDFYMVTDAPRLWRNPFRGDAWMTEEEVKREQAGHTYTARWMHVNAGSGITERVVYTRQPHGNLFGMLPLGALPSTFPGSPDDEWDGAVFKCDAGTIMVTRDRDA